MADKPGAPLPLYDPTKGCWLWVGTVRPNGYGSDGGRSAHVVAFERAYGKVPEGNEVHHFCEDADYRVAKGGRR